MIYWSALSPSVLWAHLALCAESDQVTRILKSYGDALERATAGLAAGKQSKADAAAQLRILRCVVLLLRLTGAFSLRYVPQMMVLLNSSLRPGSSEAVKLQSLEGWHVLVATLAVHGTSVLASVMNQVPRSTTSSFETTRTAVFPAVALYVCWMGLLTKLRSFALFARLVKHHFQDYQGDITSRHCGLPSLTPPYCARGQ